MKDEPPGATLHEAATHWNMKRQRLAHVQRQQFFTRSLRFFRLAVDAIIHFFIYTMQTLAIELVKSDIVSFIQSNGNLLFNERDFQTQLAVWLGQSHNAYDDVALEYYVPKTCLGDEYIWEQEDLRMDIVVEKDGEFVPVELKYKTKKAQVTLSRFGQEFKDLPEMLKKQGAQDHGMYDFWKDVRRIELVRKHFTSVKGGLAVFMTNDEAYTKEPRATSNNHAFSMSAGAHPARKAWKNPESKSAQSRPDFTLERDYAINWNTKTINDIEFHYCVVSI